MCAHLVGAVLAVVLLSQSSVASGTVTAALVSSPAPAPTGDTLRVIVTDTADRPLEGAAVTVSELNRVGATDAEASRHSAISPRRSTRSWSAAWDTGRWCAGSR